MSSWWGKPEYNGIKVLVLAVVVAGIGYFAYNSSHGGNAGQVASLPPAGSTATGSTATGSGTSASTTGKGTAAGTTGVGSTSTGVNASGTTRGGTTGDTIPVCNKATVITLNPFADNATFAGGPLYFDSNYQDGGHFVIKNPTDCPVTIKQVIFSLEDPTNSYPSTSWTPIGGVTDPATGTGTLKLHVGITTVPVTLIDHSTGLSYVVHKPNGPQFGAPLVSPGLTGLRLMTFASTTGVVIPAQSSQSFAIELSTWNTQPIAGAATMPAPPLLIMLRSFRATSMGTPTPYTWTFATSGLASSAVTASGLFIRYP